MQNRGRKLSLPPLFYATFPFSRVDAVTLLLYYCMHLAHVVASIHCHSAIRCRNYRMT